MGDHIFTGFDAILFILVGMILATPPAVKFGIEIGKMRAADWFTQQTSGG